MTIRRADDWGREVELPAEALTITTDAQLAAALSASPAPPVLVRGGDLHRAVGSPVGTGPVVRELPIDVLRVAADGVEGHAVAHVVARRGGALGWWRGPIVAVMNVDHVDDLDVAPRAHPNDGRLDVVEVAAAMPLRARWQARHRLRTGTHVPHPDIATRQVPAASFTFDRPLQLWADGVPIGQVRNLTVRVDPDASIVYA